MRSPGTYLIEKLEDWKISSQEKAANWILTFKLVIFVLEKCFLKFFCSMGSFATFL